MIFLNNSKKKNPNNLSRPQNLFTNKNNSCAIDSI